MLTSSNRPSLKLVGSSSRNVKVMQLRVELQGVRPKVWRRVLVPASIRLPKLHVVLLRVMGWDGGHLHEFEFAEGRYGIPDPDWPDESMDDESKVTLTKALGSSTTFTWTYDFGDDWAHKIKVERFDTMPAELKLQFPCAWLARVPVHLRTWGARLAMLISCRPSPTPRIRSMTTWRHGSDAPSIPMPSMCRKLRIACTRSSSS